MAANLQELVEELAGRLERSVAIDDARLHLLAHSPHRGDVDRARAESIIRRAVPRELVDHVYTCRDDATGLYLVTPRADLGLDDARVGYPILHQGSLLGFVWLLRSEGTTDDEHLDAAERAAAEAAALIHREHLRAGSVRDRERELLDRLLGDDDGARASAAAAIRAEGLFDAASFSVIVAEVAASDRPRGLSTEADRLALASGLAAVRSRRLPQHLLTLEQGDRVILVVADTLGDDARERLRALATGLRDTVLSESGAAHCRVGVSRSRSDLAHARLGVAEALRAARVGRRVHTLGSVTDIESLGVYELLDQVPDDALRTMIHPGLLELIEQGSRTDSLVQTLEVFLDNAGDVKAASEQLFAHRTSLYYRLRRIQELTGLDLSSGDDRLTAHLGLRIVRLMGLHGPDA
ncbi:PucR family transcriptional regulator [Microbacterium sp. P5_E9]